MVSFGVGFGKHCSTAQVPQVLAEQKLYLLVQAGGLQCFRPWMSAPSLHSHFCLALPAAAPGEGYRDSLKGWGLRGGGRPGGKGLVSPSIV